MVMPVGHPAAFVLTVGVDYLDSEPETYVLPITAVSGDRAEHVRSETPQAVIARLDSRLSGAGEMLLIDATSDADFCGMFLQAIAGRRHHRGQTGEVIGVATRALAAMRGRPDDSLDPVVAKAEHRNPSAVDSGKMILKFFRRADEGVNPDLEVGRFLSERSKFRRVPAVGGYVEYRMSHRPPRAVAVLEEFVPNQGNAWENTLGELATYFERVLAQPDLVAPGQPPRGWSISRRLTSRRTLIRPLGPT